MPSLAGYDVIIEIAQRTLQDMINRKPLTLPDGGTAFVFGGQFSLSDAVTMADPITKSSITGQMHAICKADFRGIAQTNTCEIRMELKSASIQIGPWSIKRVSGAATITVPLIIGAEPGNVNHFLPGAGWASSTTTFIFDHSSKSQVATVLGGKGANALEQAIELELDHLFRSQGTQLSDAFEFLVVPGTDSTTPRQFSAPPDLMWIDEETFGIFGYYRKNAFGGNMRAKTDSDIIQLQDEYVRVETRLFGAVPFQAYRFATLIAPDGFTQTIACPTIRNEFARKLVAERESPRFSGAGISAESAEAALNHFLDSPEGQQRIDAYNPPPCGTGAYPERAPMPTGFSDIIAKVYWLSMTLADQHIDVLARARADLPVCGTLTAEVPMQVALTVDQSGHIHSSLISSEPNSEIDDHTLCGIALAAMFSFLLGPVWAGLLSFVMFRVAEAIGESLIEGLLRSEIQVPATDIDNPIAELGHLQDIQIHPSGLTLIGLIPKDVDHVNRFNPLIVLESEQTGEKPSTSKALESGVFHKDKTCKDGTAHDFVYQRHWFDSTWHIRLRATDVPLPLTVDAWSIELGHRTPQDFTTDRETGLISPNWSGQPVELVASQTILPGMVYFEAPPLKGSLAMREVAVGAQPLSGTNFGWDLALRAEDGNFYLRIQAEVTDGDGIKHLVKTSFFVSGERVEFGADFAEEQEACRRKLDDALHNLPPLDRKANIPPWVPIWDPEIMQAVRVQIAMRQNHSEVVGLLRDGIERFGSGFHEQLQRLPALTARKIGE